jgi:uncharacterized protein YjiS (DUF1127 family)
MSAHTADTQYSFHLPTLSYVDAKWEEPNLRAQVEAARSGRQIDLVAWLSRQASAFSAWRRDREAAAELARMSDHELTDIGLGRADIVRVFDRDANQDLRNRGVRV